MAELTWAEKNQLALARRAEKDYQFWATGGLTKPKHDTGGDGGPRRGGKAKFTKSQVFDDTGETLTETNLDEEGTEIKVIKKTPSTLLEDQTFLSDDMDLNFDDTSIATPPAAIPTNDLAPINDYFSSGGSSSGRWGGPAHAGFASDGPTATRPWGPVRGRYLTEDEFTGAGQASRWLSRPPTERIDLDWFSGMDVEKSGTYGLNEKGTLAITDADTWDAQSKIIEDINNHRMMELANESPELYQKVLDGKIEMPVIVDPHEGKDYYGADGVGFDGSSLHADSVTGSFVSETFDKYRNEDGTIVESPFRSDAFDEDNPLFTTLHPEVAIEVKELEENLDVDSDSDSDGDGDGKNDKANEKLKYDSIETLAKEDPEKIKVLNHFASWMEDEDVSDAESLRAAEDYLENLRNEPTVHDRVKKAMAIAFAAMLFGDDLTTAMNTGFGIVADDYAAEAAAEAAEAATNAELQKTVAKEHRANLENDRRKIRDFALEMKKEEYKNGVAAAKEKEAEIKERTSGNQDYITKQATHYEGTLNEDQKKQLGVYNFGAQFDRALQYVKKIQPDVVWDLKNNVDQRTAFDTQFRKWMSDKLYGNNYGKGVPSFETYMQDAFIKTRMEEDSPLSMIDTNPSIFDLQDTWGINTKDVNFVEGMEETNHAYEKIKGFAEGYNERGTLALMAKDYYDWKETNPDTHAAMVERAAEKGIGGFIYYVNNHVDTNSPIGTIYDPKAIDKDNEWRADYAVQYLIKEGIVVKSKQ